MKKTSRALSFLMAVICLFAFSLFEPLYAITEKTTADNQTSEAIAELNNIWDEGEKGSSLAYSPIVGELTDQRSEDTKRLRRADGAIELVMYSDPVHYEADGKWEKIDNTLVEQKTSDGRMAFENLSSDFKVQFGADEHIITITYKDEKLIFKQLDTEKGAVVTAAVKEKEAAKGELTDEEQDELWRFPEELSSAITYSIETVEGGKSSDIEYKLNGKSLSEFITLNEKPAAAPVYRYSVESSLVPKLDGNVVRFENADGKTVLMFSAPYMTDAKGEESYEFKVSIEKEAGGYIYTMIPNEKWLYAKERAYPVVIDPDVETSFKNNVENVTISAANPNTNYNTNDLLNVGHNTHRYSSLIRLNKLPSLSPGDVIIDAAIVLTRYDASNNNSTGKELDAYRLPGSNQQWSASSVTWNDYQALIGNGTTIEQNPVDSLALIPHQRVDDVTPSLCFATALTITPLMKKWVSGEIPNGGVVLTAPSGNYCGFWSSRSSASITYHPYFSVTYINSTGLEDRFSYSSQSAGRAGTGSVNLYSGNLTFSVSDAGINNGTMPISVAHVYNTNDKDEDIGYGYGWRLNYAQSIKAKDIQDKNGKEIYYEYIDGDGTRHYYKKKNNSSTEFINELDDGSKLKINNNKLVISDKGDNKLEFDCELFDHDDNASTPQAYRGRLVKIEDANGNKTTITYKNASDKSDLRISSIKEELVNVTNGQSIMLSYNGSNRLSGMTAPNGLNLTFGYSTENLTWIKSADEKRVEYTYDEHRIKKAKNIDNYNLNYEYDAADRVINVTEKTGSTVGNYLNYIYGWNVTSVTDNLNRDTIYQFNNMGQAVSIRNAEGQAVYASYKTKAGGEEKETIRLSAVSKMQNTVVNLIKNHGFDQSSSATGWTEISGAAIQTGTGVDPHNGRYSAKLSAGAYIGQTVAVESGKTYTLSAYFTSVGGGYVEAFNGTASLGKSDLSEQTVGNAGKEWTRRSVSFTVPAGASSITVRAGKEVGTAGNTWVDSVQLEVGDTPNRYNMIVNSDFTDGINSYSQNDASSPNNFAEIVQADDDTHPTALSSNVLHITGGAATSKHVFQTIEVRGGKEGDAYSFGGWCKSDSVPLTWQYDFVNNMAREYGLKCLKVQFYNGSSFVNEVTAYFAADTTDWQFTSSSAVANGDYTKVRLIVCFDYTRNEAYFDGIQLYRERFSQAYSYDGNGNLIDYTSLIGQEPKFTYDSNNNVTSSKDAMGNETKYTYNNSGNVHLLKTVTTQEGTKTEYTYDAKGNVTQTKVSDKTDSSLFISTNTTYDNATALATAVTDARGNSVTYGYNSTTRQQTSITDAKGNTSTYTYGNASSMLRLASLSSAGTGTVNYTYDQYGKLTRIARSTTYYNFTYDSWGRQLATKVGSTTLSTNVYDQYGRLKQVNYGNGLKTRYEYDGLDRVKKIYQGTASNGSSTATYEFVYDGGGNLYELRNRKTLRATFFEYDHAGRCMASTEKSFTVATNGKIVYASTPISGYKYEYDANNNLSKLTCTVVGSTWATTYTYDGDNRPKKTILANGKQITNDYDRLGRLTGINLDGYNIGLTYHNGANGSKTALVSTYKNGGDAKYNYTYDANGNITQIWRGDGTFASATEKYSYSYDSANQLIRENLYYGSGNSNNKTVTYEYDEWGNILRKLEYAYTTAAELAEPIANVVLSFNANSPINGGTVPNLPSNISAAPGTTVTIPNVTPQLNCAPYIYEFVSWNTKANGTGTTYRPGQSIRLNSDVTLYAKWRLVYAPPGGGEIAAQPPEKPNEPERAIQPYPVKAYIYNYADANWKDKLTSIETYNVNSSGHMVQGTVMNLTYDAIGNPTSYLGTTLSWNGKQLSSYTRAVGSQTLTYTYNYNEDGLRTQKIGSINGSTAETTNYYYNGSVLIGMQRGSIVQRFSYDAQGKVVAVDYSTNSGSSYTTYYYLRNAQGDIVKLIDGNKNTVVEYTYDSWGKLLSTTGTHAVGVGNNQPFRYRGYVYDTETQWYYLQSRYYDPSTCRFISSDVYLSTGQGVIGHNSYAYCLNTPVNGHDSNGQAFRPYSLMMTDNGGWKKMDAECYLQIELKRYEQERSELINKIKRPFVKAASAIKSITYGTSDPQVVFERAEAGYWFTMYKGALVKHTDWSLFPSSCCLGPVIILQKGDYNETDLNHEYGHFVQFKMLGPRYYTKIAIPSLIGYAISSKNEWYYDNYYSQPWERSADWLGGVDRGYYLPYSDLIGSIYLAIP